MKRSKTDILIIGAGMAGLSLAGLLAQSGFTVTVVDREHPDVLASESHDGRTVALSMGTRDVLAPLGIWDTILPHAAAITEIDVQEGHDPFLLNFTSDAVGAEAFGWIFPNSVVRKALYEKARGLGVVFMQGALWDIKFPSSPAQAGERITALLQAGGEISAALLVGADGRFSRVRDLCGINGVNLSYRQTALVGLVEHELPHQGLAVERFYPTGPFAVLPFTTIKNMHRSAIVWTLDDKNPGPDKADHAAITAGLAPLFDARYGKIKAVGKWASYPLSLFHAKEMTAPRVALISDAAHAIHPIAGQGLNLGMRDVAVLAGLLAHARAMEADIGGTELLEEYGRARRFDVFAMVAATDILNRLFGNKMRSIRWLRSAGLGVVNRLPPLKRFFVQTAMGR
ncbi:MAG: 2-octaprenyl-6-methoxyphenol hydroxylase [Alphaproteobacteria bacterium]|nr:2-octaprenyl-6-methoxyphenol hydroxylase [Alphaproteobacteria bacterium]